MVSTINGNWNITFAMKIFTVSLLYFLSKGYKHTKIYGLKTLKLIELAH